MTRDEIMMQYRRQFRHGREIDNSVPDTWLPAIADLCASIEAAVPPFEQAGFYWRDMKEKQGELAVDYNVPASAAAAVDVLVDLATESVGRTTQNRYA